MLNREIHERAIAVAATRDFLADWKAQLAERQRQFAEDNAEILAAVKQFTEDVAIEEAALRALLVAEGKGKHAVGEVKEYHTLNYDPSEGLAWATEHGMCLALDKKAFEKVAKASPPPCVTTDTELRASLASDMGQALKEMEASE